jgi:hypothetical protein
MYECSTRLLAKLDATPPQNVLVYRPSKSLKSDFLAQTGRHGQVSGGNSPTITPRYLRYLQATRALEFSKRLPSRDTCVRVVPTTG